MSRFFITLLAALPLSASAQTPRNFAELVDVFISLIDLIIPVVFALAVLMFFWGLTKAWILGGANETEVAKGKQIALWGIIAFTVMLGVWGILAVLRLTFFS